MFYKFVPDTLANNIQVLLGNVIVIGVVFVPIVYNVFWDINELYITETIYESV